MKLDKQKIFEIVLTALVSAVIAMCQGFLTHLGGSDLPVSDPVVAGGIGAGLKSILNIKKC